MTKTPSSVFGLFPYALEIQESNIFIDSNTPIGIEIELENVRGKSREPFSLYWKEVEEHSTRNNPIEWATYKYKHEAYLPIIGVEIDNALNDIEKYFKIHKAVQLTKRTGLHIHIGMADNSLQEVYSFIVLSILFETLLFKRFATSFRETENYCFPIFRSEYSQEKIAHLLDELYLLNNNFTYSSEGFVSAIKSTNKYSSINLLTLMRLGTVEFRFHPGTKDVKEIADFINVLFAIKKYALNFDISNISSVCSSISEVGANQFLKDVFADNAELFKHLDYERYIIQGIRVIQNILLHRQNYSQTNLISKIGSIIKED